MIGLNIGCGRAVFPTTAENIFTSHLMYSINGGMRQALDPSVEWINIDRIPGPGIQEVINIFRFPFVRSTNGKPFEDNSADFIWLSHIIEHIPHQIKLSDYALSVDAGNHYGVGEHRKLFERDGDGWFSFFFECWRILKPGGRMAIVYPYGNSSAGMSDPTHTRYILPSSFSYFLPNDDAPFDYDTPFKFRQLTQEHDVDLPPSGLMRIINETYDMREALDKMRDTYANLADDDPRRDEITKAIAATEKYIGGYMFRHTNQIEEGFLVFSAIKDEA